MDTFEAYHGATAQQHQAAFDRLSRQSFRMIALCVYGDPASARYNAVWVRRPGPEYLAFHGVRDADYQGRFNAALAAGFSPVLVTSTGSGGAAIFAAVFERGVPGPWQPGAEHAPLAFLAGALFSADIHAVYERLALPVWMSHGVRGDFTDYRGTSLVAGKPNWSFTVFQAGALPHFEKLDEFVAAYDRFLAGAASG